VTERQVSRRIPVVKLPVKDCSSDKHNDVNTPCTAKTKGAGTSHTVKTELGVCVSSSNDVHSAYSRGNNSAAAKNISKSVGVTKMDKDGMMSGHRDGAKKPRLQTSPRECLLASPMDARHSQNIDSFDLGRKLPAKVSYVGSGLMPLSSPVLSNVGQKTQLSYALYSPLIGNDKAQCYSRSQLTRVLSPPHVDSRRLPTDASSTALCMLTAADTDNKREGSSVIHNEVVEYIPSIVSAQSPGRPQLIGVSYPPLTARHLMSPIAGQTLAAADNNIKSVDLSVIGTTVVENAPTMRIIQCPSVAQLSHPLNVHSAAAVSSATVQTLTAADAVSAQYPSRSHLIAASSPPQTAGRLQTASHSVGVQTLPPPDARVCSISSAAVTDTKPVDHAAVIVSSAQCCQSSLHTARCCLTTADVETLTAATAADAEVYCVDSSVIDTEVVETGPDQFSVDHIRKRRKQKQCSDSGKCYLN